MFGDVYIGVMLIVELLRLSLEQYHAEGLWSNEGGEEDNSDEDEKDPVDPSPLTGLIRDPSAEEWSKARSHADHRHFAPGFEESAYKMAALNKAMGIPRSSTDHTSAILPPTLVMGAEEAIPAIWHE